VSLREGKRKEKKSSLKPQDWLPLTGSREEASQPDSGRPSLSVFLQQQPPPFLFFLRALDSIAEERRKKGFGGGGAGVGRDCRGAEKKRFGGEGGGEEPSISLSFFLSLCREVERGKKLNQSLSFSFFFLLLFFRARAPPSLLSSSTSGSRAGGVATGSTTGISGNFSRVSSRRRGREGGTVELEREKE
jgi:hypothetical protein